MKDSVSYDQRTTTLKGVEKVNDMIGEGQGAISFENESISDWSKVFSIPKFKNVKNVKIKL